MLTLPIEKAAAGMTLALPVLHPDRAGHVLLKPGAILDGKTIARMKDIGIRRIGISFPPTAYLMRYASVHLVNEQSRVAERIADEIDKMSSGLCADFDMQTYVDGVRLLVQRLVDDPAGALFMHDIIDARKPLASHAFNVGLLAVLMGLKLDGYLVSHRTRIPRRRAVNIETLGLGALLHDIGMTRLAPADAERFDRTRDEKDPGWRSHVELGFNLVRGRIPATASAAVLHHHQRLDGSGFPERPRSYGPPSALRGEEIHVFSRIVAVADVFDRFRNPPGSTIDLGHLTSGPVPTIRALKQTLELVRAGKLDPVVYKALLAVVPAFPPGSIVTLNSGRTCVVTGWEPTQPCSPTVCTLPKQLQGAILDPGRMGADGFELGDPIDLADRHDLRVVAIEGHDVSRDHFEPEHAGEFDLRRTYLGPLGDGWEHIVEQTLAAGGRVG